MQLAPHEAWSGDEVSDGELKTLRRAASRPPLQCIGNFAKDLDAVVDFYDERFNLKLTGQEHSDLVAFLRTP